MQEPDEISRIAAHLQIEQAVVRAVIDAWEARVRSERSELDLGDGLVLDMTLTSGNPP